LRHVGALHGALKVVDAAASDKFVIAVVVAPSGTTRTVHGLVSNQIGTVLGVLSHHTLPRGACWRRDRGSGREGIGIGELAPRRDHNGLRLGRAGHGATKVGDGAATRELTVTVVVAPVLTSTGRNWALVLHQRRAVASVSLEDAALGLRGHYEEGSDQDCRKKR
jgi:hypothetical protein